jgi:ribosomal protein S16
MNEPATLTTPWGNFILAPGLGRASLRVGRRVFERPGGAHPSSGNMVATTADANAARNWVEDGATSQDHAAALLKNRLYRRWGIKTARG